MIFAGRGSDVMAAGVVDFVIKMTETLFQKQSGFPETPGHIPRRAEWIANRQKCQKYD
jgi:hypothetical protein